jgi:hypothetical protein
VVRRWRQGSFGSRSNNQALAAARPLPVHLRDPFLHAVAHALSDRNVIGPGTAHQVCRELQAAIFSTRRI